MANHLIIISGPTAIGKTSVAIDLAKILNTDIINADSRQVFKKMSIGTAVPSKEEQQSIKHHFMSHRSIHEPYNANIYEQEVIGFLDDWFLNHNVIIMVGGSGLYINAVCKGIDDLPTISPEIRNQIHKEFSETGLEGIRNKLKKSDPVYYNKVDLNNPQRIMKALEVVEITGKPYSEFLTGMHKPRNFITLKIGLDMPRQELHERINNRVDQMIEKGLIEEARSLYAFKHLNALNTVGYKELFSYFDGHLSLPNAIDSIKSHTRQYARRQLTWFHRDPEITWFHPTDTDKISSFIFNNLK